jgi:hypothetical protein
MSDLIERLLVDAKWHRMCSRADMAENAEQAAEALRTLAPKTEDESPDGADICPACNGFGWTL